VYYQVSVYLQNWSHVVSYVNKAETTPFLLEVNVILCSLYLIKSHRFSSLNSWVTDLCPVFWHK